MIIRFHRLLIAFVVGIVCATEVASLRRVPCGKRVEYWSQSCGMIGTQASRVCSHGGELVNKQSCTTHFHAGSRPCGFLRLGCQSMCHRVGKTCKHGEVQFAFEELELDTSRTSAAMAVVRRNGNDGEVAVEVHSDAESDWFQPMTLFWEDGDVNPKHFSFELPVEQNSITFYLKNVTNGHIGARKVAQVKRNVPGSEIEAVIRDLLEPALCVVSAPEGSGKLTLIFRREGLLATTATAKLVRVGGSATPVADFETFDGTTLVWEPNQAEASFDIILHDDREIEQNETIEITLYENRNLSLGHSCRLITAVIVNDDFEDEDTSDSVKFLSAALRLSLGNHLKEQFLMEFQTRRFKSGEVLYRQGDTSTEMYVVQSGSVDLLVDGVPLRDRMHQGDSFGELSLRFGFPRPTSAVAKTDCVMFIIDKETFDRFVADEASISDDITANFVHESINRLVKKPPILLFPGLASSRLIAWKYKGCRGGFNINVGDVVWVSLAQIVQTLSVDAKCWLDCLALEEDQADSASCKLRGGEGLSAIQDLIPGLAITTIFGDFVNHLVNEYQYDIRSIIGLPYDWRLSPDMMESRDGYFSKVKAHIEIAVAFNEMPAVAVCHSQGNNVLLYFVEWMKLHYPDSHQEWFDKHIGGYFGLGAPLLGAPEPIRSILAGVPTGLPISDFQAKKLLQTFGSTPWFIPIEAPYLFNNSGQMTPELQQILSEVIKIKYKHFPQDTFNNSDLLSGKLFDELTHKLGDPVFSNLKNILTDGYLKNPLNPLRSPPTRPPFGHICMLYGVDMPTGIGYTVEETGDDGGLTVSEIMTETKGGALYTENVHTGVKTHHGVNQYQRSGDRTVPYRSLSWAHSWHHGGVENVTIETVPSEIVEYYDHPLGRWGEKTVFSLMNTREPEYTQFSSNNGVDSTTVVEIDGLDHRDIVKHAFTMKLFKKLFIKMAISKLTQERKSHKARSSEDL